jgi:hypothetical protein
MVLENIYLQTKNIEYKKLKSKSKNKNYKYFFNIHNFIMSCLGPGYNPNPQRVWSRVQNQCTYNLDPPTAVFVPLTGQTINLVDYPRGKQMLLKGNILQYKKNSSNLTKQQRYSQIAKGLWTNRTKSWASQTQTSTNPNTSSLLRVNYETIPIINQITDPFGCTIDFLKEGGTLVGNTVVNPCTGKVIKKTFVNQCNPSSASNVPGPIIPLCWDSRVETWYPRQNLTMNNSTDKWPVNYKLFKSANALVSGTEVSQDFLYGNTQNQNTNTLNEFNISNIYSEIVRTATLNEQGPFNLNLNTPSSLNYNIENAGVYIIQTSIPTATINLPQIIGNLNIVTIINKSENYVEVSVTNNLQFIYNIFFALNDNSVTLSPNTIGNFKFVINTDSITDAGLWYLNLH